MASPPMSSPHPSEGSLAPGALFAGRYRIVRRMAAGGMGAVYEVIHTETDRRREKQKAYNKAHGITPQTVRKNVEDVLAGLWQGDTDQSRVTTKVEKAAVGQNLAAHLDALRQAMRKAAENLEFEEAARLRDEVKRLEAVELAVSDDPLARQSAVDEAVDIAVKSSGRSTAGRPGQRGGVKRRSKR